VSLGINYNLNASKFQLILQDSQLYFPPANRTLKRHVPRHEVFCDNLAVCCGFDS
jgi:hypothetical protein